MTVVSHSTNNALVPQQRSPSAGSVQELTGRRAAVTSRPLRLVLEALSAVAAALTTVLVLGHATPVVVASLLFWVIATYHRGTVCTSAWARVSTGPAVRGLIGVAVLLAVASGAQVGTSIDVRTALAATSAAAAVATVSRILERRRPVRTVLVGDRVSVSTLAAAWQREPRVDLAGFAVLEPDLDPHEAAEIYGIQAWTTFDGLVMAARTQDVDAVVVAPSPSFSPNDLRRLAWELEDSGVSLAVVSVLDSAAPARISTTALGGKTLHEVAPARPARSTALVKSLIDRSVGAALLVLAAPVLAAVVLAIRLDSPGPGLFAQERVGLRGKRFTMYKLRTMRRDAEDLKRALSEENDSDAVLFKMKQDPRVTRLGRLLRRSSLDELPQLINVVKGEMSLVGPRPALPDEVSQYDDQVRRRLAVKPGLTGLWQVSGRSDLPWDQAVRLDLYYADNVRVVEDLRIALRTVDAVLHSRGAY